MSPPLLSISRLSVASTARNGALLVDNVSFDVFPGEAVAIVGESGSGKTLTIMSAFGLVQPGLQVTAERADFMGRPVVGRPESELARIRGRHVGFVFQDHMTSFNPMLTVGTQLAEPLRHHLRLNRREARERAGELMQLVGIPGGADRLDDYPHQLSGGMRQRAMIATAIACNPALLIADEPTTALDVTTQAQIVDLVRQMRHRLKMATLWVTHDLALVGGFADRIIVFRGGVIVEQGPAMSVLGAPRHPYTKALLAARPRIRLPASEGRPDDAVPFRRLAS
jgi:peptide/nickel transport system ATP-binding protein